jgi:hypothetical protein
MKTSFLFWSFVVLAVFPAYLCAQQQDTIEGIPLPESMIQRRWIPKDLVPDKVKDAVLRDFGEGHKPMAWIDTLSRFNDSEWQKSTNVAEVLSYALRVTVSNGSTLDAVYTPDGKMVKSREYVKNFRPELNIMQALRNTEYGDWDIKKNSHLIKGSSSGPEKERYAFVMQKGKEKKTIYFDENSRMIAVQPGEHGELADLDR